MADAKPFTATEALAWLDEIRDVRKTILDPAEYLRLFQANIDRVKATIERLQGGMQNISFDPDSDPESKPCKECQEHKRIARSFLPQDDSTEAQQAIGKEKKPC